VVSLTSGDHVYMVIPIHVWFRIEKETFFMTLIKLNNDIIEK